MYAPKTESSSNFEKHPMGSVAVVCTRVIDLGTHFNEKKQVEQRKISIGFESSKLIESDGDYKGQPFLLFANFNYSMYQGKAHLCNFIEDWRGKRFASQDEADVFDIAKLIGQPAFANVTHSECGKWVNIQSIMPIPEGIAAPEIKGLRIIIDQDNLIQAEVDKLSDNMKTKVLTSKEQKEPASNREVAKQAADTLRNAIESENPAEGMEADKDVPF